MEMRRDHWLFRQLEGWQMKSVFKTSCMVLSCLAVLVGLFASSANAQDYRAKIQGLVTDATQASVVDATVTLKNVNTGVEEVRKSDASGRYQFDFVQPGTYSVSVEAKGFQRTVQENVLAVTRGDVTVNFSLKVGDVTQAINVSEQVGQVDFNSATITTTVSSDMVKDLPVLARNPYTLALLNPAVVNQYWDVAHRNPFYMWSSGGLDIGGPTGGKNDQELDGVSLNISARGSYNLPMDAVQEVSVQQNSADAEYGFSAGGTLLLSQKSGTNEYHGTAYYFGRNPSMDALTNRITRDVAVVREQIGGGTIGSPIIKNKLFNFFAYEKWKITQPSGKTQTLPTSLERTGDFSQSMMPDGSGIRPIYDPTTTVFDPQSNSATRTPFAGNVIPGSRLSPAGKLAVNDLWQPNNLPGDDASGTNNLKKTYPWWENYWNLTDRVDYNVNDKWRMYARFSKYQTRLDNPNWGGTIAVPSDNGGIMDALNAAIDVLWTVSPRTTIDFRFGSTYVEDDYASQWAQVPTSEWAKFFPTGWYKNVLDPTQGIYYPNFNFNGSGTYTGIGGWWLVHGRSHNPTVNVSHLKGKHNLKVGWQMRYSYDQNNANSGPGGFNFDPVDTGSSFLGYDPSKSGNVYASALLGVLDGGNANVHPNVDVHQMQHGLYFQDDWKISRNLTLNLGLRWEYETAPLEQNRHMVQMLDLTNPIPELLGFSMPSSVTSVASVNYQYSGAMIFTSNSHPRLYDAPRNLYQPRAGFAYRLNNKMSIRAGYARFATPILALHPETGGLPYNGFSQSTSILGPLNGMPRAYIDNPFPASAYTPAVGSAIPSNPVELPLGNALGRYTDLGNSIGNLWKQTLNSPINDRMGGTFQYQAPAHFLLEGTYFMMLMHNVQGNSMWGGTNQYNVNMMDPNLYYTLKGAVSQQVANPFYNLLPSTIMPGQLRTQPTVSVSQLLRPYPQYGDITYQLWPGGQDHFYSYQFKAERPMTAGLNLVVAYSYNREYLGQYFNDVNQYANKYTMLDNGKSRHNLRIAGTYELPFGKGRQFMSNAPKLVDLILGGWAMSHFFTFQSGQLLYFNQAVVNGDPTQNVPAGYAFNPAVFSVAPAYTVRNNPWYYENLRGPKFWELDSTLAKYFPITEKIKFELRAEFYNLPNAFIPSNPDTGIGSGTMGQRTGVFGGNYGREIQYTGRIRF
jgi:hypothetical protein